jgi:hypothetical protein
VSKLPNSSVTLVGQELPRQADLDSILFRIRFTLDVHLEIDSAHDAIPKLLLNQSLPRGAIGLHELMEAVNEWIVGSRGASEPRYGGSVGIDVPGLGDTELRTTITGLTASRYRSYTAVRLSR